MNRNAVGWCDEHARYFYWHAGCRADRIPPAEAVRAWYRHLAAARELPAAARNGDRP